MSTLTVRRRGRPLLFDMDVFGEIHAGHEDTHHGQRPQNQNGHQYPGQRPARLRMVPLHVIPFPLCYERCLRKVPESRLRLHRNRTFTSGRFSRCTVSINRTRAGLQLRTSEDACGFRHQKAHAFQQIAVGNAACGKDNLVAEGASSCGINLVGILNSHGTHALRCGSS